MKKIATLIAALTLTAPAFAAPETYNVDSTHTFARFSYSHFGMSTQLSKFNKTTGTVVLDKAAKTGSVDVVIDTGSDATIGNLALQRAVGHRNASAEAMLTSVTGQQIMARVAYPRKLSIGELDINNIAIAYADSPVFETLALNRRPAMLLGMSELRLFKRVAIDFNTRKVFFDLPPSR